ncbi:MAG: response regulator transcription factor [Epsilonproteobacteria bacterium]|nr:response regulator transcription factor [Campylobacterota bacterium]
MGRFFNGFEILTHLRDANDTTPAFYITAQVDTASIAKGFDVGAEEYIKKPFDPEELVVRIKHRYNKEQKYERISYNPYTKEIHKSGKIVVLGEVSGNIFHTLFMNKNHLVTIEQLYGFGVFSSAVAYPISMV